MHRNTLLVVAFLGMFAALVVGFNFGKRFSSPPASPGEATAGNREPTTIVSPTPKLLEYQNEVCGISFQYPATLTRIEGASGSAILVNQAQAVESVTLICQKEIPQLSADRVNSMTLTDATGASVAAKLYREVATEPGILRDKLIFRHPRTGLTVLLAGAGATFERIISSLKLLP